MNCELISRRVLHGLSLTAVALLPAACTAPTGQGMVRDHPAESLIGLPMHALPEKIGMPDAYFVTPDGETSYLTYASTVWGSKLTTAGCVFLFAASGGVECPQGQSVQWQCALLRFDASRRLDDVAFRDIVGTKCSSLKELDELLSPAVREPVDKFVQLWQQDLKVAAKQGDGDAAKVLKEKFGEEVP